MRHTHRNGRTYLKAEEENTELLAEAEISRERSVSREKKPTASFCGLREHTMRASLSLRKKEGPASGGRLTSSLYCHKRRTTNITERAPSACNDTPFTWEIILFRVFDSFVSMLDYNLHIIYIKQYKTFINSKWSRIAS